MPFEVHTIVSHQVSHGLKLTLDRSEDSLEQAAETAAKIKAVYESAEQRDGEIVEAIVLPETANSGYRMGAGVLYLVEKY